MSSSPPEEVDADVGDEPMEEDGVDMLPTERFTLPACADAVVELWRAKMAEGALTATYFQDHWRVSVPRIYSPLANRNCLDWTCDEELAQKLLIRPLEQFVWGLSGEGDHEPPRPRRSALCGRVFKAGEPAYSCRECGMDNTCVLCVECFKVSAHRNHKYKMGQSGGGGCCDCGDTEAWKRDHFCELHAVKEEEGSQQPESTVGADVVERMRVVSSVVLSYCFRLLTLDHAPGLPHELRLKEAERDPLQILDQPDCYCTVLYNDETHTFEQVITTLMRVMKCRHRDALDLVSQIDREGRALVKCSSFQACEKLKADIEKFTSRHGPSLKVLVMHAHVVAHQTFAMKLLNWLQTFVSQEQSLRLALSQVALGEELPGNCGGLVQGVMQNDCHMWKAARNAWHRLLIATTLMDYSTKRTLAILFTKNYASILKDFIRDDHDHSCSVSSLSVQLYTTPTLAHHLIAEHDALFIIMNTFLSECVRRCNARGRLEFERNNVARSFKRAQYILYDMKYLLSAAPTVLDDPLRRGFLHGLSLLLNLLVMMQGMDGASRQVGQHMEYEPEWESAFNLHVKLAHGVTLVLAWCAGDRALTLKAYRLALRRLHDTEPVVEPVLRELGSQSASVIPYDVSTQPTSIHLPLSRFVAGLHLLLDRHGLSYHGPEFQGPKPTPEQLIEPVLRTCAMVAQVHAGMWRRNGFALLNQLYFYHNVKCRPEMLDRDIVMLQVGASLIESNEFIIHLLNKLGLLGWASSDFEDTTTEDESMRHTISLVEELLGLLISIIGSRYVPGVGEVTAEDRTKKEIIQMLCVKPMAHSELNRTLPEDELLETGLEAVINEVADFNKSGSENRGMYTLKPHLYDEYDTFFYHYTREELSRSEEAQRARRKAAGLPECCPPPMLPRLAPPFRLLAQLLQCDAALYVLRTVLQRSTDLRARSYSDTQVHKVLHLMGYALRDEESGHYEFVAFAECAHRAGLHTLLQKLIGNARVEAHVPLIHWTLAKMRSILGQGGIQQDDGVNMESAEEDKQALKDAVDPEKERRAKLAAARRVKLMAQMQAAQNKFISNNATMFGQASAECAEPQEVPRPACTGAALGAWGGGLAEPARICIMCQEEARVELKEQPLVLVAFVQHSTVLNRNRLGSHGMLPTEWAEAWLPAGVGPAPHVSSCGHTLHASCWRKYVANVMLKQDRRTYRLRQPASFDVDKREYLCPLCERLCNTALPLLPSLPTPSTAPPPLSEEEYSDAISLVLRHQVSSEAVHKCTELCVEIHCVARSQSDGAMSSDMESTEGDSTDDTPMYMSTHSRELLPSGFLAHFEEDIPTYSDEFKSLIKEFAMIVNKVCGASSSGGASQLANMCRATAYSVLAADAVLRAERRPLLGDLPARHRDALHALVRLAAAAPAVWPTPKQLAHHTLRTLNALRNSPLTHYPFSTLVTLVLSIPALFSRNAAPARPANLSRQLTIDAFKSDITRALLVADLTTCLNTEVMEVEGGFEDISPPDLGGLLSFIKELRQGNLNTDELSSRKVWEAVQEECRTFLRCSCLFFHFLSDVDPPVGLTEVDGESWDVMCDYLNLPKTFQELFGSEASRKRASERAAQSIEWFSGQISPSVVREPREPPKLIALPEDFSELVNMVSVFSCPNLEREDSKYPTMCLVCGQLLCSQSYCCQTELSKRSQEAGAAVEHVGAVVAHCVECGAGAGLFLRVRDCELLLLAALNRGAMTPAPYLDAYGETDQGLRRGNPLRLCPERYEKLRMLWLSHGLHERIARSLDTTVLVATQWQTM